MAEIFICTSDEKPALDFKGNYIGQTPKRILCYSRSIGRGRIYRQSVEAKNSAMNQFEFLNKRNAQVLCDKVNKANSDDFKVELLIVR